MITMNQLNRIITVLAVTVGAAYAEDQAAAIRQKLESEYKLTKVNADKDDIVTAGSVIVLHKDRVMMLDAKTTANPCMNTYRDGKISSGACGISNVLKKCPKFIPGCSQIPTDKAPATHTFVDGEKFWMTKIDVKSSGKERGVVFDFFTDGIGDPATRYAGRLTIPFGADIPSPDEALKLVQTVITVDTSSDDKAGDKKSGEQGGQQQAAAPSQPASEAPAAPAAEAPPAPAAAPALEAPPAPPADPVNVSEGQTIAQVEAALGQPVKKVTAGTKVIYVYKDLKITFLKGKVSNVE